MVWGRTPPAAMTRGAGLPARAARRSRAVSRARPVPSAPPDVVSQDVGQPEAGGGAVGPLQVRGVVNGAVEGDGGAVAHVHQEAHQPAVQLPVLGQGPGDEAELDGGGQGAAPPTATLSHSSARSAPAWAETRTPSMFSTQVSTTTWSGARQGAGEGWRKGSILGSLVAFMGELCHA